MGSVGEQLHVVARHRAALAIPHHVGFRIGSRGARHKTVAILFLLALHSLHFAHRRFQTTLALPCRPPPRRHLPPGPLLLCGRFLLHQPNLLARPLQVSLQLLLAAEGVAAGMGFDLRPVQRHPLQGDQTFRTQHSQHLHEQIVQRRLWTGTKPGKRAVADPRQRAQPLKGRLVFAPPRHLAPRTDAAAIGIQPETDQDLRVGMIAPRPPLHRGDGGIIAAQIQPPHQLPNRARGVICLNQPLHLDGPHHHLAAIHTH